MIRIVFRIFIVTALISLASISQANSSCSAENSEEGRTCSIDCDTGQIAICEDASGNGYPRCECEGAASDEDELKKILFSKSKVPKVFLSERFERTNVISVINEKLSKFPYHIENSCREVKIGTECNEPRFRPPCPPTFQFDQSIEKGFLLKCGSSPVCRDVTEKQCSPIFGVLSAIQPFIIEKEPIVKVHEPNWEDIPTEILVKKLHFTNCSPLEQVDTFEHTRALKVGTRVVKTKTIDVGREINAKVEFNFMSKSEIGVKFSSKTSITDTRDDVEERSETFRRVATVRIPPRSVITATHKFISRVVPINFEGTIQLDGQVSPNQSGINLISQVLKNPEDRNFAFSGQVLDSNINDTAIDIGYRALSDAECGAVNIYFGIKEEFLL